MRVQTESHSVQKRALLPTAHEGTLRERLYAGQLVHLRAGTLQTRQTVLPAGGNLLQDRHERAVSERTDSAVRSQREAVSRWDQLQRGVRMYKRDEERR